ncbi:MAG: nuclease-related domain-containing protein [Gammaproteobacteria bacterium]
MKPRLQSPIKDNPLRNPGQSLEKALFNLIDGEKAVGQYLDSLRENGYQVFHDIQGDGFNLDHVIIGPSGIFTIETRTRSKPVIGRAKIIFTNEGLKINGREADQKPVIQAKAQANWLRKLLLDSTGRMFDVKPVVVFPGWFIERAPDAPGDLWVLEPKALPAFLSSTPEILTSEYVKISSYHLSRYIRSRRT